MNTPNEKQQVLSRTLISKGRLVILNDPRKPRSQKKLCFLNKNFNFRKTISVKISLDYKILFLDRKNILTIPIFYCQTHVNISVSVFAFKLLL